MLERLLEKLETIQVEKLAAESEFVKQPPRKVGPREFLLGFFLLLFGEGKALRNLAIHVSWITGCVVSKQAFHKRIREPFVKFLGSILLAAVMEKAKVKTSWMQDHQLFKKFNRVLAQDSTTISLDEKLMKFFPGAANKTGQKATAKIQTVIDLVHEEYCHFELGAFTKNDQAAAEDIISILEKNDLVLRDLGYFTLESISKIENKGAFYSSRLRYGVAVFTEDGSTRIDLAKTLKKKGCLDTAVRIGSEKKILTRLIAVPVDDDTANERRRKARQNRDKRLNHSQDYFTLLGWKSHFKLTDVPKANVNRVKAQIYATLIWITFFQTTVLTYYNKMSYEESGLFLSMMKMAQFLREMGYLFLFGSENEADMKLIAEIIVRHCTYEKRNRLNYPQTVQQIG